MKKRFLGLLLFTLFFSTNMHLPASAATTSPVTSSKTANEFVEMFEIDSYTASNPYILVSGNTATIMFSTDEDAKVSVRGSSTYDKSTEYTTVQELTVNNLNPTNQLILTVTNKSGVSKSYPITIKTTSEPKQKVMPMIAETAITNVRRSDS
ncbi:hypothetical protein PWEIH_00220 [Listeria weihenstephanensis FSL R9-0317]|uniref:Cadherin-like beta sandwich domain-containing protein n=1 Tax=Listeria weihenstephanensis TaxID=1006155 RepID=A0A1S7FSQ9_9LIST|nr:hypothetical protein [Listeria weihenstephanensis]AQY50433.1 hypothetical protein UE46_04905 [Listeria weihenstephanensis]EUJ41444.1 hypothetical protein PWEIH_00220 [Listeria weihenstephanensis FSL R9-0317]MBC1501583.1 hypothetical protein [Listeria weihenstephanensis]